jgi:hypothetical protein
MIALRGLANIAKNIKIQPKQVAYFSDSWKDRDEAAEKVYISRSESTYALNLRGNYEEAAQENIG